MLSDCGPPAMMIICRWRNLYLTISQKTTFDRVSLNFITSLLQFDRIFEILRHFGVPTYQGHRFHYRLTVSVFSIQVWT